MTSQPTKIAGPSPCAPSSWSAHRDGPVPSETGVDYNAPGPSQGHAEQPRSPEHRPSASILPRTSQGHRGMGGRRSTSAPVSDPPCLGDDDPADDTLADDLAASLAVLQLLGSLRFV